MLCAFCQEKCTPSAYIVGKDGHMYGVCRSCLFKMTLEKIRSVEYDEDDYTPGLIEDE